MTKPNKINIVVSEVTKRIRLRSSDSRSCYLSLMNKQKQNKPARGQLSCTNLAHGFAAAKDSEKIILKDTSSGQNVAIVTAYNDMLSAHQPYAGYPDFIKSELYQYGMTAQVAGGVPAMCDGVTQGQPGMDLSLFSRDVIALSTAIAMSHQLFDGMILLGTCDKIIPGLLIGALRFGFMPALFIPAGPMPTGISNAEKAKVRQHFIEGSVDEKALLDSESAAYSAPGTCTFYGTANSNQLLLEAMGLMLPGAAFAQPASETRQVFNRTGCQVIANLISNKAAMLSDIVNECSIVNAIVALLATGGSTNLTIHWIAVALAAGIKITWEDINDLSEVVPLIAKVYPNGPSDINEFHKAGGTAWVFNELISAGLMHVNIESVYGEFSNYSQYAYESDQKINYTSVDNKDDKILASYQQPFSRSGGLKLVTGNLGRAIVKLSAVPQSHWSLTAKAAVFDSQESVVEAYKKDLLNRDVIVVVRGQGPRAQGMPELHRLMPVLTSLQDKGYRVALITDGRLSGASGKVLFAIHVVPEAALGGPLSKISEGDLIELDAVNNTLNVLMENKLLEQRVSLNLNSNNAGVGRELFSLFRQNVSAADKGAISIQWEEKRGD